MRYATIVLLSLLALPSWAQRTETVQADRVPVRKTPDRAAPVQRWLQRGDEARVTGTTGAFFRVTYQTNDWNRSTKTGYARRTAFRLDSLERRAARNDSLLRARVQRRQGRSRPQNVLARSAPRKNAEVRYEITSPDQVRILSTRNGFYEVRRGSTRWSRDESAWVDGQAFDALRRYSTEKHVSILRPGDPGYKNPAIATLAALFVTGGGHFYAGEDGTGALLLGMGIVGPLVGYVMTESSIDVNCNSGVGYSVSCEDNTNWEPLYIGLGVGVVAHLFGVASASGAAERANRQRLAVRPTTRGVMLALRF